MIIKNSIYDTEAVRLLLELDSPQEVYNMSRPGHVLHSAHIRRGVYNKHKVDVLRAQFIRRRLAARLGRISPRLLDDSASRTCNQCKSLAVMWEGKFLCEEGHTSP